MSASGPRCASALERSEGCANAHVVPESTLPPCETKDVPGPFAVQFVSQLPEKTEFTTAGLRVPSNE